MKSNFKKIIFINIYPYSSLEKKHKYFVFVKCILIILLKNN